MRNANRWANGSRAGDQMIMSFPTNAERDELMRRDRAARYGIFAWRIAKAGGFVIAGLAAGTVGLHTLGGPLAHHAAKELSEIITDPPWG